MKKSENTPHNNPFWSLETDTHSVHSQPNRHTRTKKNNKKMRNRVFSNQRKNLKQAVLVNEEMESIRLWFVKLCEPYSRSDFVCLFVCLCCV